MQALSVTEGAVWGGGLHAADTRAKMFGPQRNSTGGEDFAFYLEKIPGCFINVGTGVGYPNHHPKFYADEAALTPAAEYLEKLLVEALRQ